MPSRAELAVGIGCALISVAPTALTSAPAVGVVAAAVAGAVLGASRRRPRLAWLTAVGALLVAAVFPPVAATLYVLAVVHAFCAGRWDERGVGIAAVVLLTGAAVSCAAASDDSAVPQVFLAPTAWGAGLALGGRERVADQLRRRAGELEDEHEAHVALSVRYERARIASELHDIVAHAISVMVVQASAGQRLTLQNPELVPPTFEAIEGAARRAEQDMGRLVELLGAEGPAGNGPDLALFDELVERASASGLSITLRLEVQGDDLPPAMLELAYRVVQEGVTNALRYAAGAAVRVLLRAGSGELLVEVENGDAASEVALTDTGTGNGLRGLRERLDALGGTLFAGPTVEGWRLTARLPLDDRQ